jgi:S-formylglutathione hydrolase FrmB
LLAVVAALALGVPGRPAPAQGALVTDSLWSQALAARKRFLVYLPPSYATARERRYPVVYYLHGLYGAEDNWTRLGGLKDVMDSLVASGRPEMIVVMPDGDDGWYMTWNKLPNVAQCRQSPPPTKESVDTYCVAWPHYDDYIARDLVRRVDARYRTRASRAHRGIAGLSMGGYGAVTLAMRYPDTYAAAASHSGVLSPLYDGPHPFATPARYLSSPDAIRRRWDGFWFSMGPAFGTDTVAWRVRDPATMVERLASRARDSIPALYVDVGVDDAFVDESRDFHHSLDRLGVSHSYREWPGKHDWAYWRAHVGESLTWLASVVAR